MSLAKGLMKSIPHCLQTVICSSITGRPLGAEAVAEVGSRPAVPRGSTRPAGGRTAARSELEKHGMQCCTDPGSSVSSAAFRLHDLG